MEDPPSSSGCRSVAGVPSEPVDNHLHPSYAGEFGEYLSNQYSVLKLVLSYLNYYDLNTLREVNASCKAAADILLKKRMWIQYTSLNYTCGTDHRPEPVHEGHFVDLRIEPKLLFTFECMAGGLLSTRSRPKICMRLRDRNDNHFFPRSDIVPNSVQTFVPIGAKGIFFPERDEKNGMAIVQTSALKKLALLYLPANDNYDVSVFTRVVSTESFDQDAVRAFFAEDTRPIRGMIFLKVGSPNIDPLIRFIVKSVTNNQDEPFALSGGHVSNLDYNNPPKKNIPGVIKAIILRGNGIHCVSDCISHTDDELVLKGLKATSTHVKKTLGTLNADKTFIMMFQCVDRHGLPDHTHLANTFPNIPIFGMQTWGEIGFKSFDSPELKHIPKKQKLSVLHSVKTTFIIVAID